VLPLDLDSTTVVVWSKAFVWHKRSSRSRREQSRAEGDEVIFPLKLSLSCSQRRRSHLLLFLAACLLVRESTRDGEAEGRRGGEQAFPMLESRSSEPELD
jgi:hypothetical protein